MKRRIAFAPTHLVIGLLLAVVTVAWSLPAQAQRRRNPLDGQPAVRHRLLLVKQRFEITPTFESSVNADFRHTISGGLKLELHVSDMLSIGALGLFGQSFNTGLSSRIIGTLPTSATGDPTPTQKEFEDHLNSMPLHGAAYATITPWYGKLAAFGKFFLAFDFYFSGGVAIAQLTNNCDQTICSDDTPAGVDDPVAPEESDFNPNNDPPLNDGMHAGVFLGGGIHVFMNNYIALDLSFRNYLFRDNPSGLDFTGDFIVQSDDLRLLNHFFAGIGVSFFFPTRPDRTE